MTLASSQVALAALVLATACSGAGVPATRTAASTPRPTRAPLGVTSSTASAVPVLDGKGTATPKPFHRTTGTRDSGLGGHATARINLVYDTWMTDVSGLFANLTKAWVTAVSEIATPSMTAAAARSAGALLQAHDHAVGTLTDSKRAITVKGATATLTDCLDELHWYVVEDANATPDPSVTLGHYVGSAAFVLTKGQWYLSSWQTHPERCTPWCTAAFRCSPPRPPSSCSPSAWSWWPPTTAVRHRPPPPRRRRWSAVPRAGSGWTRRSRTSRR